jgi:hypothetical protein
MQPPMVLVQAHQDAGPDRATKHAGQPFHQGLKWLASKWYRERGYG